MEKYRFTGDHAEEVIPGQFSEPGDEVHLTVKQAEDENVKRLLDEGRLQPIEEPEKDEPGRKEAKK